jgi:hypothetical protein
MTEPDAPEPHRHDFTRTDAGVIVCTCGTRREFIEAARVQLGSRLMEHSADVFRVRNNPDGPTTIWAIVAGSKRWITTRLKSDLLVAVEHSKPPGLEAIEGGLLAEGFHQGGGEGTHPARWTAGRCAGCGERLERSQIIARTSEGWRHDNRDCLTRDPLARP